MNFARDLGRADGGVDGGVQASTRAATRRPAGRCRRRSRPRSPAGPTRRWSGCRAPRPNACRGLAERAHLARLDVRQRRREPAEIDVDQARHQIGHCRSAALVGHVHDVDLAHRLEKLEGEMGGAAGAGRRAVELARPGAGERQKLGDVLGRQVGAHHQQHGIDADRRHRREIDADVVGHVGIERGRHRGRAVRGQHEDAAVGRRLGDRGGGDLAVGAGAVLDHHRALQPLGDAGRHDAGQKVVRSARRKAHDEAQRTVGEIRRLGARDRPADKSGRDESPASAERRRSRGIE